MKPSVTEIKASAPLAKTVNAPAPTKKTQAATALNMVQEGKQTPADTQPEQPKKELVLDMSSETAVSDKPPAVSDDERKVHESAEAKRKAEWGQKSRQKQPLSKSYSQ